MYRGRKEVCFIAMALAGVVVMSPVVNAQTTDGAAVASEVPAVTTPPARVEGETTANYLARIGAADPGSVSGVIEQMLQSSPTEFAAVAAFASDPGTQPALASEAVRGLAQSAKNPVVVAQQASAYALSNPANAASIVSIARQASESTFSQVMGEGLALAANTRRSEGNTGAASGIQTQATAPTAPTELTKAFTDNFVQTAAPAAASTAAAGGGNISNGTSGPLGGPSNGDTSVAQSGPSGSSSGSSGFSFAGNARTTYVTNTTILPTPGPEAGAGIGTLAMGGLIYWLRRRNRGDGIRSLPR
ncbi:hypothetical protein [Neorhizobium sp. NCHU2750]|uniref:hypothetical protein n=1 Tax=Neorhizobium sp. NCHU2750 TaxID=1825976 RepID=UPI000E71E062|nr:hypothetical protein NCHU2750_11910 [Neorhizobium sp. NCHU2750]